MDKLMDSYARYDGPVPRQERVLARPACREAMLQAHLRRLRKLRTENRTDGLDALDRFIREIRARLH